MTAGELSRRKRQSVRLLLHGLLICGGILYVFPFLWMLGGSLKTAGEFFTSGLGVFPKAPQWGNYLDAWSKAKFGLCFGNTVFISSMTVLFTLLFSSMAGYVLSRTQIVGKKFVIGIIVTTLFLPKGYTILPIVEIVKSLGLLHSLWAVIIVQVGGGLIFSTFLFMGYFTTMPRELEESAMMDGASFPRIYWSVMLPLAGPISATVILFNFIGSWNDFFTPLVFSLGRPELRTLAVGMYAFQGENSREWTLICAGAVITILPIVVLFLFLQRYFIEGISGAVKG
jgi:raffinose/stachyose/melibiose transport system permease protein